MLQFWPLWYGCSSEILLRGAKYSFFVNRAVAEKGLECWGIWGLFWWQYWRYRWEWSASVLFGVCVPLQCFAPCSLQKPWTLLSVLSTHQEDCAPSAPPCTSLGKGPSGRKLGQLRDLSHLFSFSWGSWYYAVYCSVSENSICLLLLVSRCLMWENESDAYYSSLLKLIMIFISFFGRKQFGKNIF